MSPSYIYISCTKLFLQPFTLIKKSEKWILSVISLSDDDFSISQFVYSRFPITGYWLSKYFLFFLFLILRVDTSLKCYSSIWNVTVPIYAHVFVNQCMYLLFFFINFFEGGWLVNCGRLGDVEYVVCRDDNGKLQAFHNVCRHHASLLAFGSGKKACFTCPYHVSWLLLHSCSWLYSYLLFHLIML